MSRVLPILFNGDMVRAILDGRKTVTRRVVKYKYSNTEMRMHIDKYGSSLIEIQKDIEGETRGRNPDGSTWRKLLAYIEKSPPYRKGDILYVRETWNYGYIETPDSPGNFEAWFEQLCPDEEHGSYIEALSRYFYKADEDALGAKAGMVWRPSIHMPKQAARIWLEVTDVRAERLQDIGLEDCMQEGIDAGRAGLFARFSMLWDSTVKKPDLDRYGWNADPWVWVIEFERCENPESEG